MMYVLLLLTTSVLADIGDNPLLGVCAIYQAAYPDGHTQDDLDTPMLQKLPSELGVQMIHYGIDTRLTTDEFLETYEPQRDFCETNRATLEPMIGEVQADADSLSPASLELLEVGIVELAALLDAESNPVTSRRNLFFFRKMATGIKTWVAGVGASIARCFGGKRRRALAASESGSRLMQNVQTSFEVPTMDIFAACANNVPTYLCSLPTAAVIHTVGSAFCGGSSLSSCAYDAMYALEFVMNQVL